jgi:hypothetical protein
MPADASGCQRMPAVASGCQRMPADASGCQRMPADTGGCRLLPADARGCFRMLLDARIIRRRIRYPTGVPRELAETLGGGCGQSLQVGRSVGLRWLAPAIGRTVTSTSTCSGHGAYTRHVTTTLPWRLFSRTFHFCSAERQTAAGWPEAPLLGGRPSPGACPTTRSGGSDGASW